VEHVEGIDRCAATRKERFIIHYGQLNRNRCVTTR
jgi:hypothetical protein